MHWLKRLLGLGGERSSRHREFLADLGGDALARQFDDLVSDPKRAVAILETNGWGRVHRQSIDDIALLHVAMEGDYATGTDWAALPEEILEGFASLGKRLRLADIPESANRFGAEIQDASRRGHHVFLLYPKIAEWAAGNGCSVVILNIGSDMYHFCLVSPEMSRKWNGVNISGMLTIQALDESFATPPD